MEIKILEERENLLFNRKEIVINVETDVTPKLEEARNIVSEEAKVPVENVKIKKVEGSFGKREFKIHCFVYKTKEDKEKMDVKTRKQRKADLEQVKKDEAARKEAEKQAEENKEEKSE
jgi:ribosomal protein S24E